MESASNNMPLKVSGNEMNYLQGAGWSRDVSLAPFAGTAKFPQVSSVKGRIYPLQAEMAP